MDDLKLIKKYYGEKMSHLCRELFPTILETSGKLFNVLSSKFAYTHLLYADIIDNDFKNDFKNIIYKELGEEEKKVEKFEIKTPHELLRERGYTLYECRSEEDIQSFRHFYYRGEDKKPLEKYVPGTKPAQYKGEELCTFNGNRLDGCYVFFAVKDNADDLKRKDFINPKRQDEYGTSVISIQFSKGDTNTLSIKNRYNHTVSDPDATFSNNLENIVAGLTEAFEKAYNLNINANSSTRDLPSYVLAEDGKLYRYNMELDNVYYCSNNIIIENSGYHYDKGEWLDNTRIHKFDKSRFIVFDQFILDMQEKTLRQFTSNPATEIDGLTKILNEKIETIEVLNNKSTKEKTIIINGTIELVINEKSQLIKYKNPEISEVPLDFLVNSVYLEEIDLLNATSIGKSFCCNSKKLRKVNLPNVTYIDDYFISSAKCYNLKRLDLPSVHKIGDYFMEGNKGLEKVNLPNVEQIGRSFLYNNNGIKHIELPSLLKVGANFLCHNYDIESVSLPKLKEIDYGFMRFVSKMDELELPSAEIIDGCFLEMSKHLIILKLPKLKIIEYSFLINNLDLEELYVPEVESISHNFLYHNKYALKKLSLPKCEKISDNFMCQNESLIVLETPCLKRIPQISEMLNNNPKMRDYVLAKVKENNEEKPKEYTYK